MMTNNYSQKKKGKRRLSQLSTSKNTKKRYFPTAKKGLLPELTTWEQIQTNIIDNYQPPKLFSIPKTFKINSKIKHLIDQQLEEYHSVSKKELTSTLKFLFNNYKYFLFFSIRKNIVNGYYIYNVQYQNKWNQNLKTDDGTPFNQFYQKYMRILGKNNPKSKIGVSEPHKWYSNNCVLKTSDQWYFKDGPAQNYIKEFLEMLKFTKKQYKSLPDSDFIINRMDFPLVRKDKGPSYQNLYPTPLKMDNQPNKLWFLCSQSKTKKHLDIVIPNSDEWEKLNELQKEKYNQNWESKKNIAIWRGSSTGCQTTIKDNPRLWYTYLSSQINKDLSSPSNLIIDIKINKPVNRLKVNQGVISYLNQRELPFKIDKRFFVDMEEQSNHKYIFNIEGNVSAYRYGTLFATKSLIINVESDYYLWFEPLLSTKEIVTLRKNISKKKLQSSIEQLIKNDSQSQKIAVNGYKFFQKYINPRIISQYWFYLLINFNRKQNKL